MHDELPDGSFENAQQHGLRDLSGDVQESTFFTNEMPHAKATYLRFWESAQPAILEVGLNQE